MRNVHLPYQRCVGGMKQALGVCGGRCSCCGLGDNDPVAATGTDAPKDNSYPAISLFVEGR